MDSISRTRAHNVDDDVVLLFDIWTDGGICLNGNEKFDKGKSCEVRKTFKKKVRKRSGKHFRIFHKWIFDHILWIRPYNWTNLTFNYFDID